MLSLVRHSLTCHSPENLLLSNNAFTGRVEDLFDNFQALEFADFANNQFTGFLPSSLFEVPSIRFIYFSNNRFRGSLPSNYGSPPLLRDLYVDGNMLAGTVPPLTANQLQSLTEFLLQNNDIGGQMPASVCSLVTQASLEDLWADCSPPPQIVCQEGCCTQCFP